MSFAIHHKMDKSDNLKKESPERYDKKGMVQQ